MGTHCRRSLTGLAAAAVLAVPAVAAAQPTCPFLVDVQGTVGVGGVTHTSIQAAVDDLPNPGPCVVTVRPGTYAEAVVLEGVNSLSATALEHILIAAEAPADAAAADAEKTIVAPPADGTGFTIERSKRVTLKSFDVRGGREAIVLRGLGGGNANEDVVLDGNDLHGNGAGSNQGAVTVGQGSARTWVVNNLIRDNAGNGILVEGSGAPGDDTVYLVNNTVLRNGYNGARVTRKRLVYLVNNLIVGNGTAEARGGGNLNNGVDSGRFGLFREAQPGQGVLEATELLFNVFYRNGEGHPAGIGGDIANVAQVFEGGGDTGNSTTFGNEHGTPAIVGCVFTDCAADHDLTEIFVDPAADLRLVSTSPAVDYGLDDLEHNGAQRVPVMDFEGQARPVDGDGDGVDRTDVGYDEAAPAQPAFRAIADCSPTTGIVPLKVRFRSRGEFAGGSIIRYRWDFQGDGTFDTSDPVPQDFVVTLDVPGVYAALLEVTNNFGEIATDTCSITVSAAAPVARADADPSNGPAPLTVTFTGTGFESGGSIIRHSWDFEGDGVFDFETSAFNHPQPDAITFIVNHANCGSPNQLSFFLNGAPIGTAAPTVGCVCNVLEPAFRVDDPAVLAAAWNPSGGNVVRVAWGSGLFVAYIRVELTPGPTICLFDRVSNGGCALRNLCNGFQGGGNFSAPTDDGTTTTIVTRTYTAPGVYPAVFQVTDGQNRTARASAASTSVRVGPPGTPVVRATGAPTSGDAPLAVSLGGSATDDGQIVLWEWDFDGDGGFDFSSATSPAVSHTYTDAGAFVAALRATDDQGLTSIDLIEVAVGLKASLTVPDDTFDPVVGELVPINTSISAGAPVRLVILDRERRVVRTLVNELRPAGAYQDFWNGRDDAGNLLPQAPYFAVLEYQVAGETLSVDLTDSTGGVRYNPGRNTLPSVFRPFEDNLLTINFTIPPSFGASEVLAFIGLFNVDVRFLTLIERVPLGVGTHTIHWDGRAPDGSAAEPPPGDAFLFGIFGFTLPDNAIMIQSAPVVSGVRVDPNYFDPSTPSFLSPAAPVAVVTYNLNKTADVELTVTNLETGAVLRRFFVPAVAAGNGHTIAWDGRAEDGLYADKGDYRLTLRAIDSAGNVSINRFALVRVFH